jgi:predicted DNA-binding transcriptional regulator YafY
MATVEGNEKFDKLVSLKPTKESQSIVDFIEAYQLEGCSLSEYFRNMFASYARLPQERREAIIFKKQRETILTAIEKKQKIFLQVSHTKRTAIEIAPYALTAGKEEMHGYLLGVGNGSCLPLRLSRIASVTILEEKFQINEAQKALLDKMITYGPQFVCRHDEDEVVVQLTDKGVEQFKKMYVHRPIPSKVEGNTYYFNCAHTQIIQYFQRFGAQAYILSPARLRDNMLRFYRGAYYSYMDNKNKKTDAL